MSSETQMQTTSPDLVHALGMASVDDFPAFDRVMHTAEDRPVEDSLPPLVDPAVGHQDPELAARRADVDEKHRRIIAFLQAMSYEAVVLTRADSIAWFTSGGDLGQDLRSETASAVVFINRTTRAVLADNVQTARIFEEELAGLGFLLKERPWHQDPAGMVAELAHGKKLASDGHGHGLIFELDKLKSLRRPLTELERKSMRELGRTLTLAVEATCWKIRPGETEAEVAGQLSHRLIREGVLPVELRVAAGNRLARYRQPNFKAAEVLDKVVISVTGRRHGLCASVSRTVAFGPIDEGFRACHTLASMVGATCFFFSRKGEPISEVFRRARRIYEKFHHPHEWTQDYQGAVIGYTPREILLLPDSQMPIQDRTALRWGPSVGIARSEDTILVDESGFEVITESRKWPMIEVTVKGVLIPRPAILPR